MLGLTGAHRVGKTTLAKQFAESAEIPFVQTSTSEVMKKYGFDPQKDYNFTTRLYIQERILDAAVELYKGAGHTFITDRTPIDMLSYTMADIQRENVDEHGAETFANYMKRCFEVTNQYFSTLIIVQPGIKLVEDATKAPCNMAYIEHINSLIIGLATDERTMCSKYFIKRNRTDLTARVNCVYDVLAKVYEKQGKVAMSVIHH